MSYEDFINKVEKKFIPKASGGSVEGLPKEIVKSWVQYPDDLFSAANESSILFHRMDPVNSNDVTKDIYAPKRIALYMPPSLKINYGCGWEEVNLTIEQRMDIGGEIKRGVIAAATDDYKKAEERAANLTRLGASHAGDMILSGENISGQLDYLSKKVRNPRLAMMFKGVDFRTFSFSFKLMARSQAESEAIKNIILAFKSAMHPSVEGGSGNVETDSLYWDYPDVFNIFLRTGVKGGEKYLYQIKTAALTEMSVNYAGSGIPSFFAVTGAPVEIDMDLTFKELSVLTRDDVHRGF